MNETLAVLLGSLTVSAAADVSLSATDGTALHGTHSGPKGAGAGVVLVHMAGRSGADW